MLLLLVGGVKVVPLPLAPLDGAFNCGARIVARLLLDTGGISNTLIFSHSDADKCGRPSAAPGWLAVAANCRWLLALIELLLLLLLPIVVTVISLGLAPLTPPPPFGTSLESTLLLLISVGVDDEPFCLPLLNVFCHSSGIEIGLVDVVVDVVDRVGLLLLMGRLVVVDVVVDANVALLVVTGAKLFTPAAFLDELCCCWSTFGMGAFIAWRPLPSMIVACVLVANLSPTLVVWPL